MTDGERLRAVLARVAGAGGGADDPGTVGLRAVLERVDATVLPRCLTLFAGDTGLALAAVERRLLAVDGVAVPDGPGAAADLGARLAQHLAQHLAADPAPRLAEAPWPPGAAWDAARGLSARAIAAAVGLDLWPDRSPAARLLAWVTAVQHRTVAAAGHGALAEAGIGWGDADALAAALARLAPDGPEALAARGLAGPAGGAVDEAAGLVVRVAADGSAILVAGSPDGGVVVLADPGDLPDLIRDWQAA